MYLGYIPVNGGGDRMGTPKKRIALVLSGGGARGAFQCGAERYAREVKGFTWDIIAGVSVGALNGTMLAMGKYQRLYEVWNTISNDQVYTGGFNLLSVIKLLLGAKSFYGNEPLWRMLQAELDPALITADLRIGAVSLLSGEYIQFTRDSPDLAKAILASTVMPVIWTPVDISPELPAMVDGGLRNISPLGDVLALEPDEIVVINCQPQAPHPLPAPPANVLQIGLRTLDLMINEIFVNDLHELQRINALVRQAAEHGLTLSHPRTGRPLRDVPCYIIEPDYDLGDTLDFSQETVQASLQAGVRRAKEVLGDLKRGEH
jgi:NTE family protein